MIDEIVTINDSKKSKILRKKTANFDFEKFSPKEIRDLVSGMRKAMHAANGIGLSANQIGLDIRMFVAEIPDHDGGTKFYSVFNPAIEKIGDEKKLLEEGCLSVPGKYGNVMRATRITITGFDKYAKPVRIKAWGLLAHVFQHEIDHLNGIVFIDKAKEIFETPTSDRLKEREAKMGS